MVIFSSSIVYMGAIVATVVLATCFQNLIINVKKKNNLYRNIFINIIIVIITMPLVVLSGMRGDNVGVDTYNYINIFEMAGKYTNFGDFYKVRGEEEFLYSLFTYVIRKFTNSRFLYLGGLQFFALAPIVKVAIDESDEVPLWKTIFIYTCWYFTDSLNAMRQFIAVAFLLMMYKKFICKEYKKGVICLLIASGFHTSAMLIGPIIILICYLFVSTKVIFFFKHVILILCFSIISFGQNIIVYIFELGFMPSRWVLYINTFIFQNSRLTERWRILTEGHYFELMIRGAIFLSFVFFCSNLKNHKRDVGMYKYMFLLNILIYAAGIIVYHTAYAVRMSVYFDAFIIYLFPVLDEIFRLKINIQEKRIPVFSLIITILYFYIHSILIGSGGAVPYVLN